MLDKFFGKNNPDDSSGKKASDESEADDKVTYMQSARQREKFNSDEDNNNNNNNNNSNSNENDTEQQEATGGDSDLIVYNPFKEYRLGEILREHEKLTEDQISYVLEHQQAEGSYFGRSALELDYISEADLQYALALQFGYPYLRSEDGDHEELIIAYKPFSKLAENFRSIRAQLALKWKNKECQVLSIVSPGEQEGKSFVAANLAVAFSQLGKRVLLIDSDLRSPRQHEIFNITYRIGLSAMLAGRVNKESLERMPKEVSSFNGLFVLGAGAVPPNPVELLGQSTFPIILAHLREYFDVIIIDTPSGNYRADVQSIASCSSEALMVLRKDHTNMSESRKMIKYLRDADINMSGVVLNEF